VDLNTFLKHLLWAVSLMLALQVVFYFVLEATDYNSFLLSAIVTAAVLIVLFIAVCWRTLRRLWLAETHNLEPTNVTFLSWCKKKSS